MKLSYNGIELEFTPQELASIPPAFLASIKDMIVDAVKEIVGLIKKDNP